MNVLPRKNILFKVGGEAFYLIKDVISAVPKAVSDSAYFKALVTDGKIVVLESNKDSVVEKAAKEAEKKEKAKTEAVIEANKPKGTKKK